MAQLILCRSAKIIGRQFTTAADSKPEPYIHISHLRTPSQLLEDPSALVEGFIERFELNSNFHCPNCNSYFYNSKNYMEAPAWLLERW